VTTLSLRTRIGGALRILVNPPVKPGRALGAEEGEATDSPDGCPSDIILELDRCPVCNTRDYTRVGEFNRFVHFTRPPDESSMRADYSICHGCGVLFAARRPAGRRYAWLLEHFEESLGRSTVWRAGKGKLTISSARLSDADKTRLRRLASRGVFVSEHLDLSRKEYLPGLLRDRLAASLHVEILGSLIDVRGKRVLEVRSKLGSIVGSLRRLFDADVRAMAIFEAQQFLIREVYGIEASLIDFDRFEIPFAGPWDVIVCNHMLTHAIRPADLLTTLRAAMVPGGHLYLYGEPDDAEILVDGKSMFNTLNAFHLQTFDAASLARGLAANGFHVEFLTHDGGNIVCLARAEAPASDWTRIAPNELHARVTAYQHARDAAMLMLPESARAKVPEGWSVLVERALRNGVAEFASDGRISVRRPGGR
jgi:2-polyprenyl-3-methyl-5-hydroxy-6-metoxy-1,4-benzoquinol methylase